MEFVANAQAKAGSSVKATPLRATAIAVGAPEAFREEMGFIRAVDMDREAMKAYYAQWIKERTSGNVWNYLCCWWPCKWTSALCGCCSDCCGGDSCVSTPIQPFHYERYIAPILPWNRRYENIERVVDAKGHVALTDHGIVYKELEYATILYSCGVEVPDVDGARAIPPTSKTIPWVHCACWLRRGSAAQGARAALSLTFPSYRLPSHACAPPSCVPLPPMRCSLSLSLSLSLSPQIRSHSRCQDHHGARQFASHLEEHRPMPRAVLRRQVHTGSYPQR